MAEDSALPPPPPADGARVLALFDMDLTLLTVNSAALWLRFERREGRLSLGQMARAATWLVRYRLGILDMGAVTEKALGLSRGEAVDALTARTERWYRDLVRPTISAVAVARLEAHRAAGHLPVILTASTQYGAEPLARDLNVDHLASTVLEVADGRLTGRVVPPLCYGEGKLERARQLAGELDADLADAWFYTDSVSDLPVLEAVGHPVAVNADPRLARLARQRGWPAVHFA